MLDITLNLVVGILLLYLAKGNEALKKITIDEDGIIKDLSGINLIELNHEGCTQSSIEEQEYILHKINKWCS